MASCLPFSLCWCRGNGAPKRVVVKSGCGATSRTRVEEPPTCCEDVLEEIRLRAPASSQMSMDKVAKVEDESKRCNLLIRFRKLFVKGRTPEEELEMEELRNKKKAVIKYLKGKNLYNRRMTYEQMEYLKAIAERPFCETEKDQCVQEIEMKEMKSASEPSAPEANSEQVVIQKPESKSGPIVLLRPEGSLEETDGNQNHSGDIQSVQCNPEPVIVQAKMSNEKKLVKDEDGLAQRSKDNGENPPPLPKNVKSWVNISEHFPIIKHNDGSIGDVIKSQGEANHQVKGDQEFPPPALPFDDGTIWRAAVSSQDVTDEQFPLQPPTENDKSCKAKEDEKEFPPPLSPEMYTFRKQTKDQEIPRPQQNPNESDEFPLLPLPEDYSPWKPKEGEEEFPPPPPAENDDLCETVIIPRSNKLMESKLNEIMDPAGEATGGSTSAETDTAEAVERPRQAKKWPPPPVPERKNYPRKHTATVRTDINVEHKKDKKVPPPIPAKKHKPRIVGFTLKPRVNWADVDKIELDPTYDEEEEESKQKMKSAAESSQRSLTSDPTPPCLQDLRWKFHEPYRKERLEEREA